MLLAAFFPSCCCYEFWLPFPPAAAETFCCCCCWSSDGKTPWKKSLPGSKTQCLCRTETRQNCTSKMPNVTSETHRQWWWNDAFGCFFSLLLLLWILATFYIRPPNRNTPGPRMGKHHGKKSPPHRETPCLWRTEKPQNCTPKMPKVTSETSCFCRDFCCRCWTPDGKTPCLWRTEKKLQNGIPKMPKVTSETP